MRIVHVCTVTSKLLCIRPSAFLKSNVLKITL